MSFSTLSRISTNARDEKYGSYNHGKNYPNNNNDVGYGREIGITQYGMSNSSSNDESAQKNLMQSVARYDSNSVEITSGNHTYLKFVLIQLIKIITLKEATISRKDKS